ncbi:hypothetical protein D3C84_1109150 [compost metagenome]
MLAYIADNSGKRFWVIFVPHLCRLCPFWNREKTISSIHGTCIVLQTEKVVLMQVGNKLEKLLLPCRLRILFSAWRTLNVIE